VDAGCAANAGAGVAAAATGTCAWVPMAAGLPAGCCVSAPDSPPEGVTGLSAAVVTVVVVTLFVSVLVMVGGSADLLQCIARINSPEKSKT
jgi:hypothetical protein